MPMGWLSTHVIKREQDAGNAQLAAQLKVAATAGPEAARALLDGPPEVPGDEAERLFRRNLNLPTAGCNPQQDAELRHGGFSVAQPVAHESRKAADSGAVESVAIDSDLAAIVASWPTLPAAIRAGILAMVKAAGTQ